MGNIEKEEVYLGSFDKITAKENMTQENLVKIVDELNIQIAELKEKLEGKNE